MPGLPRLKPLLRYKKVVYRNFSGTKDPTRLRRSAAQPGAQERLEASTPRILCCSPYAAPATAMERAELGWGKKPHSDNPLFIRT